MSMPPFLVLKNPYVIAKLSWRRIFSVLAIDFGKTMTTPG
jgi:hypothetical protein